MELELIRITLDEAEELYNKLKTDGCRFKDVSETNFSVII